MARRKKIPIGGEYFERIVKEYDVFVDKTHLIQEVIDSGEEAILVIRPRRWGKSLNLDMLKTFFGLKADKEGQVITPNPNHILFEGGEAAVEFQGIKPLKKLSIAKINDGAYMEHQGAYPVISLSFKDATGNSFEEIATGIRLNIQALYRTFRYLETSKQLTEEQLAAYKKVVRGEIDNAEMKHSIKQLSELLFAHHGKKSYILVDEYDKPVNYLLERYKISDSNAEQLAFMKEVKDYMSSLLSNSGKSNPYREKIILTGIYDLLKKEGNSGFNNIKVFDITDVRFHDGFGFVEHEISTLITELGFVNQAPMLRNIKDWYNGYSVPLNNTHTTQVYTPWAVMNYLNAAYVDQNYQPESYWTQSGASTMLSNLLPFLSDQSLRNKFHSLAHRNSESLKYDKQISLLEANTLHKLEEIFSYILLHSGYFTAHKEGDLYYFNVPNKEVHQEFEKVIENEIYNIELYEKQGGKPGAYNDYKFAFFKTLDELKGSPFKKAMQSITEGDSATLKALVSSPRFEKCESRSTPFNLFHIGALSGNITMLESLWAHCDHRLLAAKDGQFSLTPLDYAFLAGKEDTMQWVQAKAKNALAIPMPEWHEVLACSGALYVLYNIIGVVALTGLIKYTSRTYAPREVSYATSLFVAIGTDITLNTAKTITKFVGADNFGLCNRYEIYSSIDTAPLSKFHSLKQFEKYTLLHPDTYTTINQPCNAPDHPLTTLESPMFYYEDGSFVFRLCQEGAQQEL